MEIDFQAIELYLDARKNKKHFISRNLKTPISIEQMGDIYQLVKTYGKTEVMKLVEPAQCISHKIRTEIICEKCSFLFHKDCAKTLFFSYIETFFTDDKAESVDENFLCKECLRKLKEDKKNDHENQIKKRDELEKENTLKYINVYLNPESSWNKGVKISEMLECLQRVFVNWKDIALKIKSMKYQDFLKTPYWKAISKKKKLQAGFKCQLCNHSENLATHHRTYEIHGDELNNMKELIVLCESCHSKFHDKDSES